MIGIDAPNILNDSWQNWKETLGVVVLEEIYEVGEDRRKIVNALKTVITEPRIETRRRFKDNRQATNHANYLAFSNHMDALKLDKNDRRWWVVFNPLDSPDKFEAAMGMPKIDYFDALYSDLENPEIVSQLAKYLGDYEITDEFTAMAKTAAPGLSLIHI